MSLISPILAIIFPMIIMGQFLDFNNTFGPWTKNNFLLYQLLAYNISLLSGIIYEYSRQFNMEKYMYTLSAIIIAPVNRFNLLFGIFFSHLMIMSIPFLIFFIISYIYYPISIVTIIFIIGIYLLIALSFAGIGIIIGIFAISKEGLLGIVSFIMTLFFWTSCLTYPFQIYPEIIQNIISLNPLYYLFDTLRWAWFEDDIVLSLIAHIRSFTVLIISAILLPIIGVIVFKKMYIKYGIRGF